MNVLKLYANCVVVRGQQRSTICDLQKDEFLLVPNTLADFIDTYQHQSLAAILEDVGKVNHNVITEYIDFLINKELAFWCPEAQVEHFPAIDFVWKSPAVVTNCIIDLAPKHIDLQAFKSVQTQLDDLGCLALQIRVYQHIDLTTIRNVLSLFNTARLRHIDVLLPYQNPTQLEAIKTLISDFPRITYVVVHSAPQDEVIPINEKDGIDLITTRTNIDSSASCGVVSHRLFTCNMNSYTEGLNHNSCLNKKISIDQNGFIKNCPSQTKSYGHIADTKLEDALLKPSFKQYWNITKDQIDTCKGCEFRSICTDCRIFRQDPQNIYSKPLKCGYDPATTQWSDWSTNSLKQKSEAADLELV